MSASKKEEYQSPAVIVIEQLELHAIWHEIFPHVADPDVGSDFIHDSGDTTEIGVSWVSDDELIEGVVESVKSTMMSFIT